MWGSGFRVIRFQGYAGHAGCLVPTGRVKSFGAYMDVKVNHQLRKKDFKAMEKAAFLHTGRASGVRIRGSGLVFQMS